jgi:hypothetical protein
MEMELLEQQTLVVVAVGVDTMHLREIALVRLVAPESLLSSISKHHQQQSPIPGYSKDHQHGLHQLEFQMLTT